MIYGHDIGSLGQDMPSPLRALIGHGIVWDNHACMPLRPHDISFLPLLEKVREHGVTALTLNIAFGEQSPAEAISVLQGFRAWLQSRPDHYVLIDKVGDLDIAVATNRLGICFNIEGATAIGGNLDHIAYFYAHGVRWMLLAYNRPNEAGGGCLGNDDGLTEYGLAVIRKMNSIGMTVCASHCGYRTAFDIINQSTQPVIFSHSNPRAVCDHPRNIPDDLILACASKGGVIGLNGFGPFVGSSEPNLDRFVDHIEYVVELAGDDHVGIGLDYVFDQAELDAFILSNPATFPKGVYPLGASGIAPWQLSEIANALIDRGHTLQTVKKILGENMRRIAEINWRD